MRLARHTPAPRSRAPESRAGLRVRQLSFAVIVQEQNAVPWALRQECKGSARREMPKEYFCAINHTRGQRRSNAHWLLAGYRDGSQPLMAVRLLTPNDCVELFLNGFCDWSGYALTNADLVNGADGRNLSGRAGEESFVCDVEHFARDSLFDNLDAEIAGNLQR